MKNYITYLNENKNDFFKVGDRVSVNGTVDGKVFHDEPGEIITVRKSNEYCYEIMFDRNLGCSTCPNNGRQGACWWVYKRNVSGIIPLNPNEESWDWELYGDMEDEN